MTVPDYHMHTVLCKHAAGHVSEYREAARAQEMPELCFSDHAPDPDGYDPLVRMGIADFPEYKALVAGLQDGIPPPALFGIEADYYESGIAFLGEWLPNQGFDLVLGSVHYIEDWCFDHPAYAAEWDRVDVEGAWRRYFTLLTALVRTGLYDVVAHFDLPKKFGHRLSDNLLGELVQPVLDTVAEAGMGIELNTSGLRRPVGEIYPCPLVLSLAHEREIPICFGSDAHAPQEVGAAFPAAVALAREVGYTHFARYRNRERRLVPLDDSTIR